MIPFYKHIDFSPFSITLLSKPKLFTAHILFAFLPRLLGFIFTPLSSFLSFWFIFIRIDLDHFGPWMHLVISNQFLVKHFPNKVQIVLASSHSIHPSLLRNLPLRNLFIIFNPLGHLLLSPHFFSRPASIDINGSIILSHQRNSSSYSNFHSVPPITSSFLESYSLAPTGSRPDFSSQYSLFYARTGEWQHSTTFSKRNMPYSFMISILEQLLFQTDVVLISPPSKFPFHLFTSYPHQLFVFDQLIADYTPLEIYSYADSVIGSASGATHFPSVVFNLRTLYFTDIPLEHLNQYYLPPSSLCSKSADLSIPYKDKWYILPSPFLSTINSHDIRSIVSNFLNLSSLHVPQYCSTYYFSKPYTHFSRSLISSSSGNIVLLDT